MMKEREGFTRSCFPRNLFTNAFLPLGRSRRMSRCQRSDFRDYPIQDHNVPKCPLEIAMGQGVAMIKYLISQGATVPPPTSKWNKTRQVYEVLREARIQQLQAGMIS
jgi:hypothetical protein